MKHSVQKLLVDKDLPALEKMADEMRQKRQRFTDGDFKLNAFYSAFNKKRDEDWLKLIADLEAWNRAYPLSITARIALARGWYQYGWFARGGGPADSVKGDAWKLYRDRLGRAIELTKEPDTPNDCPERFILLLKLARSFGAEDDAYNELFRQAISFDPDYHHFYLEKAVNLLPRWGGAPGAWLRFAEDTMKAAPAGTGKILYARIISQAQQNGEIKNFKESGISWPTLRDGYQDLMTAYPGSVFNTNRFAMFACLADDMETFRNLAGPGFIFENAAWGNTKIDPCLAKAGLPTMREASKGKQADARKNLEVRVFQEMLGKAQKGDRKAMAVVGEMYFRGNGVGKNGVKSYAWLVLSGEERELLDEVTRTLTPDQQREGMREVEELKALLKKSP